MHWHYISDKCPRGHSNPPPPIILFRHYLEYGRYYDPTHKLYLILNGYSKMHWLSCQTSAPGVIPTPLILQFGNYLDSNQLPCYIFDGHDKMHWLTYKRNAVYTRVTVKACGPLVFKEKSDLRSQVTPMKHHSIKNQCDI